jgi:hypothetical protein
MKLALGGIALAITASVAASLVVPKYVDPEQKLARVARRVAAGPSSVEDAKRAKKEFASAIREYLKNNGQAKSAELTAGLQKRLPSQAYEVHIAELQRGMRVVEIDTLLQASDYLLMKTPAGMKVFDLPGFEVFDDARLINDQAGPILALIGHSGGPPPHHPVIRTYALLPDFINDETDKLVPPCKRDGRAKFAANAEDIALELSQPGGTTDKNYGLLHWANAKYTSDFGGNSAKLAQKQFEQTVATAAAPSLPTEQPAVHDTGKPAAVAAAAPPRAPKDAHGQKGHTPAKIVVRGLDDKPVTNALTDGQGALSGAALAAAPAVPPAQLVKVMPAVQPADNGRHHSKLAVGDSPTKNSKTKTADTKPVVSHPTATAPSKRTATVAAGGVTLRSKASKGSAALTTFGRGTIVQVLDQAGNWYHVRYRGQSGYLYAPLVNADASQPSSSQTDTTATAHDTNASAHKKHQKSTRLVADVSSHHDSGSAAESHVTPTIESTTDSTSHSHSSSKHHKHSKHVNANVQEAPNLVP